MANVIELSDGTTSIDLYLDADGFEMLARGNDFGMPKHKNLLHASDFKSGEDLIRKQLSNREWPLRLAVRGQSNDNTANVIAAFMRLANQASRYETHGDVDKVYLKVQLNTATYPTYFDVVDVRYNSAAFFSWLSLHEQDFNEGISMTVTTKPTGRGDVVKLHNLLIGAGFLEDGNTDGLADGWNETGTPTTTLDTTEALLVQSQKVVTDTGGTDGIVSDTYSLQVHSTDNPTWVHGSVWVNHPSGDLITINLYSPSLAAVQDTVTLGAAGQISRPGVSGLWFKAEVSASIASTATVRLEIVRDSSDAAQVTTFFVDEAYLSDSPVTADPPTAWVGYGKMSNHSDATAGDVMYCDIDTYELSGDISAGTTVIGNVGVDAHIGIFAISNKPYSVMIDHIGTADADASSGQATQVTRAATWIGIGVSPSSPPSIKQDFAPAQSFGKYIAVLRVKDAASSAGEIEFRVMYGGGLSDVAFVGEYIITASVTTTLTGVYEFLMVPEIIDFSRRKWKVDDIEPSFFGLTVQQQRIGSGSETANVDLLYLLPVDDLYVIAEKTSTITDSSVHAFYVSSDGTSRIIGYPFGDVYGAANTLGNIPAVLPSHQSRLHCIFLGDASNSDRRWLISTTALTSIELTPQTEALLGTL